MVVTKTKSKKSLVKSKSKSLLLKTKKTPVTKSNPKKQVVNKGLLGALGVTVLGLGATALGYNNIKKNKKINELVNENKKQQDIINIKNKNEIDFINQLNKPYQDEDNKINRLKKVINISSTEKTGLKNEIKELTNENQELKGIIEIFKNEKTGFIKNIDSKVKEIEKLTNEKLKIDGVLNKCNKAITEWELFHKNKIAKLNIDHQQQLQEVFKQLNESDKRYLELKK